MAIDNNIEELARSRDGIVDLRYSNGKWYIMVSFGNIMVVVPGTIQPTAQKAVTAALDRWHSRSFTRPFISMEEPDETKT